MSIANVVEPAIRARRWRSPPVIISDAMPGGPAAAAGIKPGDILISVDGQPAENLPTVSYFFLLRDSGEKVHIAALLRHTYWIITAGRTSGASRETPLVPGDVIQIEREGNSCT